MKLILKSASLLIAAVMLFSCGDVTPESTGGNNNSGNGGENTELPDDLTKDLVLTPDKTIIHADGKDAVTFVVTLGDKVIKEGLIFSNEEGEIVNSVKDFKFVTSEVGEYQLRAEYKTKLSALVKIKALPMAIPESPVDPDAGNTSFSRRVMLTYFTGTDCPNCPRVKDILKSLGSTDYASKYITTTCHQYGAGDPAYFEGSLPGAMGVAGYPSITLNLKSSTTRPNSQITLERLKSEIDDELDNETEAGVAANVIYKDGKVVVKAVVKAAVKGKYRVGAWLLEDGIKAPQSGAASQDENHYHNIHDESLRVADSKVSSLDWSGYALGTIDAGKTAEYVFAMDMKSNWVAQNCHVVVFVTSMSGNSYYVNNVIDVKLNESVSFEYTK